MSANDFNPSNSAIFEAFQWHREETENAMLPGGAVMNFATEARDISTGAQTILEMLEIDSLADDRGDRKLLNDHASGCLLRMAITSLQMLESKSERIMQWAYEYYTPEGIEEKRARHADAA